MNRKGGVYLGVIFAIMVFISGVLFIEHIANNIDYARVGLSCDDASTISDGNMLTCLIVDSGVPYFIFLIVAIAAGFVVKWLT